jgi:hypothetical protein
MLVAGAIVDRLLVAHLDGIKLSGRIDADGAI